MPKPTVLIVDDEPDLCELLSITLGRMSLDDLVEARFKKFRVMGPYTVADRPPAPPERVGITDRLRGLLTRPAVPTFPGTRRTGPSGREEV